MFFESEVSGKIVELIGDMQAVRFKGRIDRLDIRRSGGKLQFRVVDYKTGRATRKGLKTETAILRGEYLQLPIYLSLAKAWLEKQLKEPAQPMQAAFYNFADWQKGQESPAIGPDFWPAYGRLLSENLAGLVDLVEKGVFYIRPSGPEEYCGYCRLSTICRKEHKPSAWRSERSEVRRQNDERLKRKA